jgi:hypothetical protein
VAAQSVAHPKGLKAAAMDCSGTASVAERIAVVLELVEILADSGNSARSIAEPEPVLRMDSSYQLVVQRLQIVEGTLFEVEVL